MVPVIVGSVVAAPVIVGSMVMVAVIRPLRPAKAALTESSAVTASPIVRVYTDGENPPNVSLADSASAMVASKVARLARSSDAWVDSDIFASSVARPAIESDACADSESVMLKLADMLTPSDAVDTSPMLRVTTPSLGMLTESEPVADSESVAISEALPVSVSAAPADSLSVKP